MSVYPFHLHTTDLCLSNQSIIFWAADRQVKFRTIVKVKYRYAICIEETYHIYRMVDPEATVDWYWSLTACSHFQSLLNCLHHWAAFDVQRKFKQTAEGFYTDNYTELLELNKWCRIEEIDYWKEVDLFI